MNTLDLGYYSHVPILGAVLARVRGPVLELGAGDGSTPMIHYACAQFDHYAVTADSNAEWLQRYAQYNQPGVHDLHLVTNSRNVTKQIEAWEIFCRAVTNRKWSVCFVDQAPGEARLPGIRILKDCVKVFVVHDFEADEPPGGGNYGWKHLDGMFKHVSIMKRFRPWTAVLSDEFNLQLEGMDACPEKYS